MSGKIDPTGRGVLTASEREVLAMQARNAESANGSPAAVERRQAAPATDMDMKRPRFFDVGLPWQRGM
jgi:hypothetical protein